MGVDFTYWFPIYGAMNSFIYCLTAILFLLAVILFLKNNFDIMNPAFIFCICFSGCCGLAALYTQVWDLPMHFNTAIIIISMCVFFIVGSFLASLTGIIPTKNDSYLVKGLSISTPIWLCVVGILLVCVYLNYTNFIHVARQVTNETEFSKMLFPLVDGLAHRTIEMGRWNAYRLRFATGIAYISVLAVWINIMAHEYKETMKWACLVLLYIPFMILTGGRQRFLYLILFSLVSFFLVYRKGNAGYRNVGKEFLIIGIAVIAFLTCFLGIGVINGKIGSNTRFLSVLVHYAGTNISAFDVFVNEMIVPDTQYIGTTTLDPIYGFLHRRGFDVPEFFQYITLFTHFGPVTTNVYTALYRYIMDFGYLGCALVMMLLGFFYNFLYRKIYEYGMKNWMILLYSAIVFPIFLMGREERFFNEVLTFGNISFCVELVVLYKVFEFFSKKGVRA